MDGAVAVRNRGLWGVKQKDLYAISEGKSPEWRSRKQRLLERVTPPSKPRLFVKCFYQHRRLRRHVHFLVNPARHSGRCERFEQVSVYYGMLVRRGIGVSVLIPFQASLQRSLCSGSKLLY